MALINDPNVAARIADLASTGVFDSNDIVSVINSALPAGQQLQSGAGVTTGVYKQFGEFDKVNAKVEVVTTGLWTGDVGSLTAAYTSSTQVGQSGNYYYDVYSTNPQSDSTAEAQFAIAYGHVNGSGSVSLENSDDALLPTKATYAQYKSVLLDPTDDKFSFETSTANIFEDSNSIYAINVNRARYREKMDAGNWSLQLSGSNGTFTFIDDSGKKFGDKLGKAGRVFKVVSGSLNLGSENDVTISSTTDANGKGYGLFYPDRGIIIFNPTALAETIGTVKPFGGASESLLGVETVVADTQNHKTLVQAIDNGGDFQARRTENVSTQHFFVRATNREFNYSNNPTYTAADGTFAESTFEVDPQTYITTVGLLNNSNELIAVAKTSQPINKSFDKEVLIKVKLSF
jgi:hypothetical protein